MSQNSDIPVYFERTLLSNAILKSAEVTRYAIKEDHATDTIALSTDAALAFMKQGISNWTLSTSLTTAAVINNEAVVKIIVEAEWLNATHALKNNIRVAAGASSNNFGRLGTLLVPDHFTIPTVLATPENVKYYGISLIKNHHNFTINSPQVDITLMKYHYTDTYKKDFLLQEYGGGGIFIERHNFPHIHIPLNENCHGYIIIGKQLKESSYSFTAFQIPYGFALYSPSNTIHGDGTLVGEYGLTAADPAMVNADTVLIYNKNTLKMAEEVVPD